MHFLRTQRILNGEVAKVDFSLCPGIQLRKALLTLRLGKDLHLLASARFLRQASAIWQIIPYNKECFNGGFALKKASIRATKKSSLYLKRLGISPVGKINF